MIARVLEENGLSTTSISLVREHTEKVKTPRALFVPYPFGRPLGKPDNVMLQRSVLRAALALLDRPAGPVLEDFPEDAYASENLDLPQAASVPQAVPAMDVADEVTSLRAYYEQWVAAHDGRTAVGVTGVPQRRFRGLVRFLQAFAAGQEADPPPERKDGVSLPQFLRWSADDLKAFYFEARMGQKPNASYQELNAWFWGETAAAALLVALRDRLKATGDPKLDAIAFGIAR